VFLDYNRLYNFYDYNKLCKFLIFNYYINMDELYIIYFFYYIYIYIFPHRSYNLLEKQKFYL